MYYVVLDVISYSILQYALAARCEGGSRFEPHDRGAAGGSSGAGLATPNLPTQIIPAKIRRLRISGEICIDMRIPPLHINIMLESNPPRSRILVRRLAASPQVAYISLFSLMYMYKHFAKKG